MLWFNHPRPFNRREVAMQIVARKQEPAPDTTLIVTEPAPRDTEPLRQASAVAGEPLAPIRFTVAYSLREYLSILGDHATYLLRRSRNTSARFRIAPGAACAMLPALAAAGFYFTGSRQLAIAAGAGAALVTISNWQLMLRPWVAIVGTPLFLLKRRRMPVCAFAIDNEQIERASAAGIMTRRWEDVRAVRAYSQGYLVQFKAGAMPLPYRCLDGAQSARLRGMIAAHRNRTG